MDKVKLIEKLNEAIGLELGALLQYNQYAQVITGEARMIWREFFEEACDESLSHAKLFGSRVVALGGVPCVEPAAVKQTTDVKEMLENSLALERAAVEVYTEALSYCDSSPAYRNLLEDQIQTETEDVEELEKLLDKVQKVAAGKGNNRKSKSA